MVSDDQFAALERALADVSAQVAAMSGPHVEHIVATVSPSGDVIAGPHTDVVSSETAIYEAVAGTPGTSVAEWIPAPLLSGGLVTDAGLARCTPCQRLRLDNGSELVFSHGVIGPLDEALQALYCTEGYEDVPEGERDRLLALSSAAELCAVEATGEDLSEMMAAYGSCLGRELKAAGISVR